MSASDWSNGLRGVVLRLLASVVTVGGVGALVVVSDLTVWSLSPVAAVVGGVFATMTGVAEHVAPLQAVFERGRWAIMVLHVFFLFLFISGVISAGVMFGAIAGFGVGTLVSAALMLSLSGSRHEAAGE